jgi:putative endonuclease
MYYVYILKLQNNTYYHGYSENLNQRVKEHEMGYVESTKNLKPIKLEFYASFSSKKKALDFEKYLKTQSGFAFRNKRLIFK